MDKRSILAIERIITSILELKIMTRGRNDNYFYDGFEMPILCGLVDEIDKNISKINSKIKDKYNNVNWDVINSKKEEDNGLKVGEIWDLASGILENELLESLNQILEIELPTYYMNYCYKQHKKALKRKKL